MDVLKEFEERNIKQLNKNLPEFRAGDTIKVHVNIVEGARHRVQIFEGMCIARKNKGSQSNFTVRKISFGHGVEKVFPLYGKNIQSIEVIAKGKVRRAKLYYLRQRSGKSARIKEIIQGKK